MMRKLANLEIELEDLVPRIMKENLWSKEYTLRVIKEYKRFIMMSLDQPVAPSREVDVVWHTHLLYTKHYKDMCRQAGQVFINHNPTPFSQKKTVGKDEYWDTLMYYTDRYQETPPNDIWTKFEDSHYVNIDLKKHWVVPAGDWKALVKILFTYLKNTLWDFLVGY